MMNVIPQFKNKNKKAGRLSDAGISPEFLPAAACPTLEAGWLCGRPVISSGQSVWSLNLHQVSFLPIKVVSLGASVSSFASQDQMRPHFIKHLVLPL